MSSNYKGKNWSYSIIGAILAFMIFTLSLVYIMVNQDVEVLYPDYYERTLNYDQIQNKLNEGLKPENAVTYSFSTSRDTLFFHFKNEGELSGSISFMKPNNSSLDKKFPFNRASNQMISIPIQTMEKGLWHIEIDWKRDSVSILNQFKITL